MSHGQVEGLLIITDDTARAIAQRFDGLKNTALQGPVIRRQQGRHW
jgi:hypothetical protein